MVRKAFEKLTGKETRLIVFSDDMDALRKVPDNVPNKEMLKEHIGKSLCEVPNPFDTDHKSFAEHNNAMLCEFLDRYGFDYTFVSATDMYDEYLPAGNVLDFQKAAYRIMRRLPEIADIVTHDYGEDRQGTYCPVIPIDPRTKQHVFETEEYRYDSSSDYGSLSYRLPGEEQWDGVYTANPYGGNSYKFQWKVDWPVRWMTFGVDYEMHGKDLLGSVATGQRIINALEQTAPLNYMYELFTDKDGKKISKSVGNGLDFTDWINYAPADSLRWFLFQNPRKSRKLYMEMVPDIVDRFIKEMGSDYDEDSGTWALYGDDTVEPPTISYQMLLNLVNVTDTQDTSVLWAYIQNYAPDAAPGQNALLDEMVEGAIRFYTDFIKDTKVYRTPDRTSRGALRTLALQIECCRSDHPNLVGAELADVMMSEAVYEVGKEVYGKENLRDFFQMLYQVLMGQDSGPRFGQFIVAYGVQNTIDLLKDKV